MVSIPRGAARCKRGKDPVSYQFGLEFRVHAGRLKAGLRTFLQMDTISKNLPWWSCTDLAGVVFHFLTQSLKSMKRWAILTVLLYALALLLLTLPVILITFGNWGVNNDNHTFKETVQIYMAWQYWLWLGLLMAGQVLLLLLPINIAERRLPARRPLQTPIIVTAFFLTNLFLAGILSILCAAFKESGFLPFAFLSGNVENPTGWDFAAGAILTLLVFWLVWAAIFRHYAKSDEPDALLKRGTRWLLRGSILELLIAVPSHVIVRRRDDCCAPIGTFWGIATGISVMLLCFGPGVFFLFMERFERLKPKSPDKNKPK
jgi:hypothetical protein